MTPEAHVHTNCQTAGRLLSNVPVIRARRAIFSIEDPWDVPSGCEAVSLVRATDGSAPRLATTVAAMWDDDALTIVFNAVDDGVVATHLQHDAPLYTEDVVEVFLAPRRGDEYFEIEVNPLGTTFDARIESPDGVRATMRTDLGWTCRGLFAAVRRVGRTADTVIRIPFASMEAGTPKDGDEWLVNFFRIDRDPSGSDEFSAWRPTMKTPPDFHVVAAFGVLRFVRAAWPP